MGKAIGPCRRWPRPMARAIDRMKTTVVMLTVRQTRPSSWFRLESDEHPADRLSIEGHRPHDRELAAAGDHAVGVGERRRRRLAGARVGGQAMARRRIERRRFHVGPDGERAQRLARRGAVAERQRRGAVAADQVGERLDVAGHRLAVGRDVVDDQRRRGQRQRQPAGDGNRERELAADGWLRQGGHCSGAPAAPGTSGKESAAADGVNPCRGDSRRGTGRRLRDHGPVRGPGTCARLCVTLLAPSAAA